MTTEKSQRLIWLDCCKGFAIICVVIGHIADGYLKANMFPDHTRLLENIFNVIYLFHMPLFFCLSGIAFYLAYCKNKNNKNKNKRKMAAQIVNLLWIYILFSVLLWVMKFVFSGTVNHEVSINDLYMIPLKPIGEYWYLYALLFFYLLGSVTSKLQPTLECGLFGITFLISCTTAFISYNGVFPLKTILYYFVFFFLGIILGKTELSGGIIENKKIVVATVILSIISVILTVILHVNVSKIPFFATICGTITTLAIICIFRRTVKWNMLQKIGAYSLDIYLLHTFITAASRKMLFKVGITSFYPNILINFIMAMCLPIVISFVLKKINVYFYIFKPVQIKKE